MHSQRVNKPTHHARRCRRPAFIPEPFPTEHNRVLLPDFLVRPSAQKRQLQRAPLFIRQPIQRFHALARKFITHHALSCATIHLHLQRSHLPFVRRPRRRSPRPRSQPIPRPPPRNH